MACRKDEQRKRGDKQGRREGRLIKRQTVQCFSIKLEDMLTEHVPMSRAQEEGSLGL